MATKKDYCELLDVSKNEQRKLDFMRKIETRMKKPPLTISKERIMEIACKINKERVAVRHPPYDKYWFMTISPTGDIIIPDKETRGHPDIAKEIIYPKDKILQMLYNYYLHCENKGNDFDNGLLMSYFMIFYGYINIDGYIIDDAIVECKYNPLALTENTIALLDSMKSYCVFDSIIEGEHSGPYEIELARKVPFFKRKTFDLLKINRLREDQIDELLKRKGQHEWDLLDKIYDEYKKEQELNGNPR